MKKLLLLFLMFLTVTSCESYKEFVKVQSNGGIPNGVKALVVLNQNIDVVKDAFKSKSILLKSFDGGFETDEMLLDEGTRAKYKVASFDNQIRITAFWGITQKVKSQMTVWAGYAASSAYDVNAWDQVIYDNDSKRPKKVFDYLIQILSERNIPFSMN